MTENQTIRHIVVTPEERAAAIRAALSSEHGPQLRMTAGQRRAVARAKLTDVRPPFTHEPAGWRPYLLLVVDGKVAVVRLGLIVDRGQIACDMDAALNASVTEWREKLDRLSGSQLLRFHAAVDEVTDPHYLYDQVIGR